MKFDPEFIADRFFSMVAERQNIGGGGIAGVHEKIAVFGGNLRPADLKTLESALVNKLAGRGPSRIIGEGIFEKRAGAFARRLFGGAFEESVMGSRGGSREQGHSLRECLELKRRLQHNVACFFE